MTPEQLQAWLEEHVDEIFSFMDYEPTIDSPEEFNTTLGYWFGTDGWTPGDHTLVHMGIDGMGSQLAAWIRPGSDDAPIVYFGSEGGRGVLAPSPQAWAQVLAHAPGIDEYPSFEDDAPACVVAENWMMDEDDGDPEEIAERKQALASYKEAVIEKFGKLPELSSLTNALETENAAFGAWVTEQIGE